MVPISTDWWQKRLDAFRSALHGPHDDPEFAADLASGVGELKALLGLVCYINLCLSLTHFIIFEACETHRRLPGCAAYCTWSRHNR